MSSLSSKNPSKEWLHINMNSKQIAEKIIQNNQYLSLSTSNQNKPWSAALFYATDKNNNFYFISSIKSIHVEHILKNPHVALTIFNSTEAPEIVNGVQIQGKAYMLDISDIPSAASIIYKKRFKENPSKITQYLDPSRYTGKSPFRLFKIISEKVYIQDSTKNGEDVRIEVKLI